MSYNGHKNYNHWNVSLWLNNDESLYRLVCDCIKQYKNKDSAARELLNLLPEKTPDGAPYTFSSVRHALVDLAACDTWSWSPSEGGSWASTPRSL
jgi:hypothetical protein